MSTRRAKNRVNPQFAQTTTLRRAIGRFGKSEGPNPPFAGVAIVVMMRSSPSQFGQLAIVVGMLTV